MIEPIWIEIAKQIPNLAVLVFLVRQFILHMHEEGNRRERLDESKAKLLKDIGDSCHAFQREIATETTSALSRNTTALERNSEALGWHSKKLSNGGGSHA